MISFDVGLNKLCAAEASPRFSHPFGCEKGVMIIENALEHDQLLV